MVNEDDLKRPLVPLKLAKASLEVHLETIPGRVGLGRVGLGRVGLGRVGPVRLGPILIIRLTQSSCAGAGTEIRKNGGCNCRIHFATQLYCTYG